MSSPAIRSAIAVWSKPRHTPGTAKNAAPDSRSANRTSRSR